MGDDRSAEVAAEAAGAVTAMRPILPAEGGVTTLPSMEKEEEVVVAEVVEGCDDDNDEGVCSPAGGVPISFDGE